MQQADKRVSEWLSDPFSYLGVHDGVVRTFQPGAIGAWLVTDRGRTRMRETSTRGVFYATAPATGGYSFWMEWPEGSGAVEDTYRFGPMLGDLDLHLLAEGTHWDLALRMGANPCVVDDVAGTFFAVWAPNARSVAVMGDFTGWHPEKLPMRRRHGAGVWELFVPGVGPGARYKFAVTGADGVRREKADPLARATELPPATASIVAEAPEFIWSDEAWIAARGARQQADAPISIYEMHAASWRRPWQGGEHDWDSLGDQLIPYLVDMGFTHVELMPIMEHPFGGSWGYQPLSQFAPSARFGTAEQFARFVDRCHASNIGVILDWVPAHFPADAHGLERFDGTALYEHADPREGFHPDWNTLIYNLGRREVAGMLIASALWWLDMFHVDGLRVDAVASMLYRDYSRKAGEWIPNRYGGRENLESIAFLQQLNGVIAQRCPGAIMIAEESTAFPGVTKPAAEGGLGFAFKWNMGWMNDTLRYMEEDPIHRRWHHGEMSFGLVYAFTERFILPLSHDEVVHGKKSLLAKMPGDRWQQFAGLRAYLGFMWGHPGKKLLFMGDELAQTTEWQHDGQLDWPALASADHAGVQALVRDLNGIYAAERALHASDADSGGFAWIVGDDVANSVFAFLRRDTGGIGAPLLVIANMTPEPRNGYRIGVPMPGIWREIISSDAIGYGGSGLGNGGDLPADGPPSHGHGQSLNLTLPPLALIILRHEGHAA